jgi:hypothetical protein
MRARSAYKDNRKERGGVKLKRLPHSLTATFVAAVVVLAANNAAGNEQTLDPAENTHFEKF